MFENTKRINDVYDYLLYKHIIKGQADFADALNMARPNVTAMLNGKKPVTTDTFRKIGDAFPNVFEMNWLITGELPMLIGDPFPADNKNSQTIDQSSLVNAALAAKDQTIAQLELRISEKDKYIAMLEKRIADYEAAAEFIKENDFLEKYPFTQGVAEPCDFKRKKL